MDGDFQSRDEEHEYLTAAQVGRILHVSPKTVTRWANEGRLPHTKTLGGHRRFPAGVVRRIAGRLQSGETLDEGPPA